MDMYYDHWVGNEIIAFGGNPFVFIRLVEKEANIFYRLAVKTGSIALPKFYLILFFFLRKTFFLLARFFFPDPSQKSNGT